MEKNKFLLDFTEQFIDGDSIKVVMETSFRQLDTWDSLTGMSVIVMIQDIYGVEISDAELKSCITVGDIYDLVNNKR